MTEVGEFLDRAMPQVALHHGSANSRAKSSLPCPYSLYSCTKLTLFHDPNGYISLIELCSIWNIFMNDP